MRYVAAYMLAVLGGNDSPKVDDVKRIIESVGVDVEADRLEMVVNQLQGKSMEELIKEGSEKLATVFSAAPVTQSIEPVVEEPTQNKDELADDDDTDDDGEDMAFGNLFG